MTRRWLLVLGILAVLAAALLARRPSRPSLPASHAPARPEARSLPSTREEPPSTAARREVQGPAVPAADADPDPEPVRLAREADRQAWASLSSRDRIRAVLAHARDARRRLRAVEDVDDLLRFFSYEDHPALRAALLECSDSEDRALVLGLFAGLNALDRVEDVLLGWTARPATLELAIDYLARLRTPAAGTALERILLARPPKAATSEETRNMIQERNRVARELARQRRGEFRPLLLLALQQAESAGEDAYSLLACRSALARLGDDPSYRWIQDSLRAELSRGPETDWTFVTISLRHLGFVGTRGAGALLLSFLREASPHVDRERLVSLLQHGRDVLQSIAGTGAPLPPSEGIEPSEQLSALSAWWSAAR